MKFDPIIAPAPFEDDARPARRPWLVAALAATGAALIGYAAGTYRDVEQFPEDRVAPIPDAAPVPAVSVRPAPRPVEQTIRGVINASSESTVASRMTARIIAMPFAEGQAFGAGAVLVQFDCASTTAQLRAAEAALAAYRKTYETQVELDAYEATGKNEVAVSRANLGKADAEVKAIAAQMSDCAVRAPFAGKVVEQTARRNDIAASGQPLLKIQSGGAGEIEMIVPSRWLTWIGPGAQFAFTIDETGKAVRGRVQRLGAAVDPVSKTIKVTGVITKQDGLILAGMSGSAIFDDPRAGQAGRDPAAPVLAAPVSTDSAPTVRDHAKRG
jgi:RND family efflux transporter MFP subunit